MSENIPTEPGYYWHRDIDPGGESDGGTGEAYVWAPLEVTQEAGEPLMVSYDDIATLSGEWGPRIPDPEETRNLDEAVKRSIQCATDNVRDRLAEKFLVGIIAGSAGDVVPSGDVLLAYEYADAMLSQRKRQS